MNDQQRAAMQMALEALKALVQHIEYCGDEDEVGVFVCCGEVSYRPHSAFCKTTKAITALREALAQREQQEPVAWMHKCNGDVQINNLPAECYGDHWTREPLYTTPPSVEAAIEATKEKAAQLCWDRQQWGCAEAIRSMK